MRIRKGWPLAVLGTILVFSALFISVSLGLRESMNRCTASPVSEPNSEVTREFSWDSFDWICHKTFEGETEVKTWHIPLFPNP